MCSHDDWFEMRRRADRLERALLVLIANAEGSAKYYGDLRMKARIDEARREHAASLRETPK